MKRRALLYVVSLVSSVACFYGDQMSTNLGPREHSEVSTNIDFEEAEDDDDDDDDDDGHVCGSDSRCAVIAHSFNRAIV